MLRYSDATAVLAFAAATLALAGLAWVVAVATEQVGLRFGPAVTGFLQATLGNLPGALHRHLRARSGELVVAQTSLVGLDPRQRAARAGARDRHRGDRLRR